MMVFTRFFEVQTMPEAVGTGWTQILSLPGNASSWWVGNGNLDGHSGGEFLFATGDFSRWLIASHDQVIGSNYSDAHRTVTASSVNAAEHTVQWFNRSEFAEDPLISLQGHSIDSDNLMMFAENGTTGFAPARHSSGMMVFTRGSFLGYRYTFEVSVPPSHTSLTVMQVKANGNVLGTWDKYLSATLLHPSSNTPGINSILIANSPDGNIAWSDVAANTKLFDIVTSEKITSFEIFNGRPKYGPGWNIYENDELLVSETSNLGPNSEPSGYDLVHTISM
jgi:hypothetical protein